MTARRILDLMASINGNGSSETKVLARGTVLIAGAGPVGMILAQVLSHFGVRSAIFERNKSTTKWPKMDLTNARSMEIFRRLGLSEGLRKQGVPSHIDQNVLISLGLSTEEALTRWDLPGVDGSRKIIQELNDGSQPLEAWQRLSQEIFERWLKEICVNDPLVDFNGGYKLCSVRESEDSATAEIQNLDTGLTTYYTADYIVGCDGGSSATRTSLGIPLDGDPLSVLSFPQ
jgi:2-polyprenyl-6-methoxyphenol hydroxylase-like FAD-dependent oxidoreductase